MLKFWFTMLLVEIGRKIVEGVRRVVRRKKKEKDEEKDLLPIFKDDDVDAYMDHIDRVIDEMRVKERKRKEAEGKNEL